jgi:hypothetical protein
VTHPVVVPVPVLDEDGDEDTLPPPQPPAVLPPPVSSPPLSPQLPPVIHRVPTPPPIAPLTPPSPPLALRRQPQNIRPPREWWTVRKPAPLVHNSEDSGDELDLIDADFVDVQLAGAISFADPRTFKLAMKSPEAAKWQDTCNEEIEALNSNRTSQDEFSKLKGMQMDLLSTEKQD